MDSRHGSRLACWLNVFAIDVRSLASLRVALALTVLADLGLRWTNLRVHYSDDGILPRPVLLERLDPWLVSVALINGTPFFLGLLFAAAALASLGLLVGYRTWLMTLVIWVLMLSIHWRNPFVGYSADGLLRLLLFWSLFVPLGAVWSIDRHRRPLGQDRPAAVLSLGTAGLLLQIAFMYWTTALLKSGREWRVDGSAISYAFSIQELATPLGVALLHYPDLLKALTFLTLGIEFIAPLMLFSPVWSVPLRLFGIAAIVGLQLGIWLTLRVGIFPWIASACMVAFLPSGFWDSLLPRVQKRLLGAIPGLHRRVSASLSQPKRAPWNAARDTDIPHRHGAEAPLSITFVPTARATSPAGISFFALNVAAGFFLLYVLVWNLTSVSAIKLTGEARAVGSVLGLTQSWTMFTPYPLNSTNWHRIPGTLRDGRRVELMPFLFHGAPLHMIPASEAKPRDMSAAFAYDERWRKYFENLRDPANAHLLAPLGDFLCREWNATHAGSAAELETLLIVSNWEHNLPDQLPGPPQQTVQWTHRCISKATGPGTMQRPCCESNRRHWDKRPHG